MTRKHRIEHFLSSIVGTNVHSDSSDVVEKKKEMEKNLDKILKLIGDDTSTHQEYSLDLVHKSELSSLIKEFHSGYQALYHNYDHLIGKLKNKISPKERGNGDIKLKHSSSSSDSSDSDLDESASLMAKLEEKDALIRNLDNKLESVSGENEALKLENKMVKQDISNFEKEMEEKEFVILNLKKEVESVGGENEMLKLENKEARQKNLKFEKEAEEKESVVSNLRKEIENVCGENEMLKLENKEARQEILKFKKEAEEKESVVSNLRKEIESVYGENEMLKLEIKEARQQILKLEKEAEEKESVISNLKNSLETVSDENEVLKVEKQEVFSQLSQVEKTLDVSEIKNDKLKKETLQLKEELGEINLVISNLKKNVEMMETLENDNGALHERLRVIREENEKFVQISNFEMDQLRDEVSDLNQKMEEKNQLEADLNRQLNDANIEKEVLISTNSGLLCELKEAKEDRESLKLFYERANTSIEELSGKLVSVETEHKNMQEEIERLCSKLQEEESMVRELTLKCEQLKDERDKLFDANGDLNAKLEKESIEKAELKQILEIKENENILLSNAVEKREVELQGLTDEGDKLNAIRSELEHGIDDLRNKLKVLQEEKEGVEVQLRQVDRGFEEARFENLELQGEIENLSTEKLKVEEEMKLIFEKCLENQVLGKKWEDRLRGKIVNQETCVADLGYCFGELVSTCKELRDAYVDSMVHITAVESLSTEQNREIKKLEENHLEQKEKLALSEGETAKLNVQLQDLEVQLRLSKQKLKVTETECRYKEEHSKKLVDGLNSKVRDLEGKMSKMIARLNYLENHLVETEENAKVGISAVGNRIKELKSIFDERFSSFVSRVLELNEELKFLKKNLDEELSEKEKMKIRLVELERRIKEEEMEINLKDEEKKEVIRQLCMVIEYYRENCNILIAISKRTRR
ncbi:paramyosin-like protein [Carex littledalei]|uniref:Paramyosin-like protein n=1 Tax=Carex littledalei TaxID=544730 RepID=A0A833RF23_9POAL|nr:paramyosin-like protein [Carex littledalei]